MLNQPQKPFQKRGRIIKVNPHFINNEIRAREIRLVGEEESKVISSTEALALSRERELDLVQISPTKEAVELGKTNDSQVPICRIVDYGKFLYEQKKKEKERKVSQGKSVTKTIKLGQNIGEHDMEFKKNNAIDFLKDGHKIKLELAFKGRGIVYKAQGEITLLKFSQMVAEYGKAESLPNMEGKKMFMTIAPKKK